MPAMVLLFERANPGVWAARMEPDTNHLWRFLRYKLLQGVLRPDQSVEVAHTSWVDLSPHDGVVDLSVMASMHK